MKIEFSSELMTNQKHATVMDPQSQFRMLQTQQAHILALSIGTDNVLYRTMEQPGTKAGWSKKDESSALSTMFGNAVVAKLFDVSENTFLGAFDIGLAVTVAGVATWVGGAPVGCWSIHHAFQLDAAVGVHVPGCVGSDPVHCQGSSMVSSATTARSTGDDGAPPTGTRGRRSRCR